MRIIWIGTVTSNLVHDNGKCSSSVKLPNTIDPENKTFFQQLFVPGIFPLTANVKITIDIDESHPNKEILV